MRPVKPLSVVIVREPVVTVVSRPSFAEPAQLPVQWSGEHTDGERLGEFAGRLVTMSQQNGAGRSTRDYIENIKKQGHGRVLEHANYSVLIEGVSRLLTHELVQPAAGCAWSELSQRYVDESAARFVMPPAIMGDAALEAAWSEQMQQALDACSALVEQLMGRYAWVDDKVQRRKLAREAASGVLPNSTETKIVVTANAGAWRTMLDLHGRVGAEFELRRLAVLLIRVMQQEAPAFFSDFEIHVAADRREAARRLSHSV